MKILRVNRRVVDVFWNDGWEYWARMQSGSKGYWKLISGIPMPKNVFETFKQEVNA